MPRDVNDLILHAARLARGLTLLTDGTAYDAAMLCYMNPSDWKDRPLDRFRLADHVTARQADSPDNQTEWFHTRGLTKFGLDEIETFRPIGLPAGAVLDRLTGVADELVRMGRSPNVGTIFHVSAFGLSVRIVRHRTALFEGFPMTVREVTWDPL
jgi:hypothetical protein